MNNFAAPAQDHPRCCHEKCQRFAQHQITYIVNRGVFTYLYCPAHSRAVQKDLNDVGLQYAVQEVICHAK